jgi:hypothetical protein
MKAASGITDLADQSYVYVNIAVAQAKAGDKSGAKKAFAQAMESASRITDEYRKSQAYSRITALQAGDKAEDKRAAAVMAAKAAKQERMNEEIRSWMALVAEKDFSNPVFTDFQGFMASLKDKNSYQIVLSLAKAAGEMADALKKLRAKETSWAKRRPKADE